CFQKDTLLKLPSYQPVRIQKSPQPEHVTTNEGHLSPGHVSPGHVSPGSHGHVPHEPHATPGHVRHEHGHGHGGHGGQGQGHEGHANVPKSPKLCSYFLAGHCKKGNQCGFSHEPASGINSQSNSEVGSPVLSPGPSHSSESGTDSGHAPKRA